MNKIILEFDVIDGKTDALEAIHGDKYVSAVKDFMATFHRKYKHASPTEEQYKILQEIEKMIFECFDGLDVLISYE